MMKPKLPPGLRCIVASECLNDYYVMREDQKIGRIQRLTSTARETWLWNVISTDGKHAAAGHSKSRGEAMRAIIDALSKGCCA